MNDPYRVAHWPDMHWNIAGFICACIPVLAAILVSLDVLSVVAATCSAAIAIAYVLLLTWHYARRPGQDRINPRRLRSE